MKLESAKTFMEFIENDPNHRFCSWEHCYNAFGDKVRIPSDESYIDTLSLHLSFYLASWGMYRGSSGLLWKDYKVHEKAIRYILKEENYKLRDDSNLDKEYFRKVHTVFSELKKIYGGIEFHKTKKPKDKNGEIKEDKISPTDTLISKILLGTLGCMPAFDRLVVESSGTRLSKKKEVFTQQLVDMVEEFNSAGGEKLKAEEFDKKGLQYPTMKIIDMCYWQNGAENEPL